jgi:ShK domain-like
LLSLLVVISSARFFIRSSSAVVFAALSEDSQMVVMARRTAVPLIILHMVCLAVVGTKGLKSRDDAFIGYSEESKSRCIDEQRWARVAVAQMACSSSKVPLPEYHVSTTSCSDCASWKDGKECILNPTFMRRQCAKTCGSCQGIDLRVRIQAGRQWTDA